MTGDFLHSDQLIDIGSKWCPWTNTHRFLELLCCLGQFFGGMSLRWVVLLVVVVLSYFNGIERHMKWLWYSGNFLYPEGCCSLNCSIHLINVHIRPTWGSTFRGTFWYNHRPLTPRMPCLALCVLVLLMCISPVWICICLIQTFYSMLMLVCIILVWGIILS